MGNCPICGRPLENDFCSNCGYRVKYDPPAITALKKHLTSPLMLSIIILTGVRLILSLIPTMDYDIVGDPKWSFNMDIDAALVLLSLLFIYLDAKKPVGVRIDPRGFKIIRTYYIVMGSILAIALLVAGVLMFVAGSVAADYMKYFIEGIVLTPTVIYIVAAVLILVAAYAVVLYVFIIKTISSVNETAVSGAPNVKISSFLTVMCFITAALNLVSLFGLEGGITDIISTLIEAAVSGIAGLALLNLKKEMQEIKNSLFPML